jgi:hypothetical protein
VSGSLQDKQAGTIEKQSDDTLATLVKDISGSVPKHDSYVGSYDVNNNLTSAKFYLGNILMATITLTYDVNNNLTGYTIT